VVDHHVDRPGVEVRQRMELTGTNRSIGLIVLIANAHQGVAAREIRPAPFARTPCERLQFVTHCAIAEAISLRRTMLVRFLQFLCNASFRLLPAWWLWRGVQTRSHPELGR
jgi:hypothetical protein